MKIEIWSDFVCPYCYIAKLQLEQALENFPYKNFVTIEYKSYQLDPTATYIPGKTIDEIFPTGEAVSLEQEKTIEEQLTEQARAVGLDIQFHMMKYGNTFDAHRLFHHAVEREKGVELKERFQQAYFTESALLSDAATLVKLAGEIGLTEAEVSDILQSKKYSRKVKEDMAVATEMGVQDLPFFVFNEKYAIPGVQSAEIYSQILAKVWEEDGNGQQRQQRKKAKTYYCTEDGCIEE